MPSSLRTHLVQTYLSLDVRGLACFRILLACVLALDLAQRAGLVDILYTEAGLLPGAVVQANERTHLPFALPFLAEGPLAARAVMALFGFVYLGLLLGYRTPLMQLLSLLAHTSLVERVAPLRYGADVVLQLLLAWSLLLPLGRRFSLDALRAAWRPASTVVTIGALGIRLQLAAIYAFAWANKSGDTWRDGSAVHYVLHQDRYVGALGVALREHAPSELLVLATHATLAVEALLALLIVSPLWPGPSRTLAAVLSCVLHLSFGACLGLGVFTWAMLLFVPLSLLGPSQLDALGRTFARACPRLHRFSDGDDTRPEAARPRAPRLHTGLLALRELALGLLLLALSIDALAVNPSVPAALRPQQHEAQRAVVNWLGLYQGWTLFAPDAPTEDSMLSVQARTKDGRELDPFGEVSSRHPSPQLTRIPVRLCNHPLLSNYATLIPERRGAPYHAALRAWILRYPERSADPRDTIARFTVFVLRDQSPPPGQHEPTLSRRAGVFYDFGERR